MNSLFNESPEKKEKKNLYFGIFYGFLSGIFLMFILVSLFGGEWLPDYDDEHNFQLHFFLDEKVIVIVLISLLIISLPISSPILSDLFRKRNRK